MPPKIEDLPPVPEEPSPEEVDCLGLLTNDDVDMVHKATLFAASMLKAVSMNCKVASQFFTVTPEDQGIRILAKPPSWQTDCLKTKLLGLPIATPFLCLVYVSLGLSCEKHN